MRTKRIFNIMTKQCNKNKEVFFKPLRVYDDIGALFLVKLIAEIDIKDKKTNTKLKTGFKLYYSGRFNIISLLFLSCKISNKKLCNAL